MRNRWLLSLLFFAPVIAFYGSHFWHEVPGKPFASGIIQYDQPYYLSIAREHFDEGRFRATYSNPFSFRADSKRIYFQPLTLFLALAWHLFHLPPIALLLMVGVLAGVACIRVVIQLFDELFKLDGVHKFAALACFIWGGGFLTLGGALYRQAIHRPDLNLFVLDPAEGWWFLNFGRNLLLPTESVYHLLVFLMAFAAVRQKISIFVLATFLLSLSHPFTGIQFALICSSWLLIEKFIFKNTDVAQRHVALSVAVVAFHVLYYLVFLPMDPEHQSLVKQWTQPWDVRPLSMALGYGLVLVLCLFRFSKRFEIKTAFSQPINRLLLIWIIVSLLLEKHELFLQPSVQPAHFTRGYTWSALFLLGAPVLIGFFQKTVSLKTQFKYLALAGLMAVWLNDNILWFYHGMKAPVGFYYTAEEKQLLDWIQRSTDLNGDELIVSNDDKVSYHATVVSPLKVVYGHTHCTPFAEDRIRDLILFFNGQADPWPDRRLLIIENLRLAGRRPLLTSVTEEMRMVYSDRVFRVYLRDPQRKGLDFL